MSKSGLHIAGWLRAWLVISSLIVYWDGAFVLLRPRSFSTGDLGWLWIPYKLYIQVDHLYGDMESGFVRAIAITNVIESTATLFGLYLYDRHKSALNALPASGAANGYANGAANGKAAAAPSGLTVGWGLLIIVLFQCVIFIQTVLYALNDAVLGFHYSHHNDLTNLVLIYIIPNGFWLLFPLLATIVLGGQIARSVSVKDHQN